MWELTTALTRQAKALKIEWKISPNKEKKVFAQNLEKILAKSVSFVLKYFLANHFLI
ncbi:MAG: hypothetical protein RQ760_12310 [Sedimentisphaerales bacterium]|nr:hypothetical protein [Sedimentisphaerales bacterium]